jgi:carbonic anhydrase/acetyltransferase-like protein (isoleucine patch superfamily)
MGRPARRVRPLTRDELEYLEYAADHYVRLKDRYAQGAQGVQAERARAPL